MQRTENFRLCQLEATDKINISEFNENMGILEQELSRLSGSTIAFSIPVAAWIKSGDTYTATVTDEIITADSIPEITLDSTDSALAAGLLNLVQTDTGILRFWSTENPDSVISGTCRLVRQVSQGVTT